MRYFFGDGSPLSLSPLFETSPGSAVMPSPQAAGMPAQPPAQPGSGSAPQPGQAAW